MENVIKAVKADIAKRKRRLSKTAIRENFGEADITELRDKYSPYDYNYTTRQKLSALLDEFAEWCASYTGE